MSVMLFSLIVSCNSKALEVSQSADIESTPGFWSFLNKLDGIELFFLPIIMAFFYFLAWIIVGNDESSETIIPVFYPPKKIGTSGEIDPGSVRYAMQGELDNYCFKANLFDLAIRGYISIEEESSASGAEKISFLTRSDKMISNELPVAEVSLLGRLFNKDGKVLLLEDSILSSQAFTGSEADMREYGDKIFTLNREYWIISTVFLLFFPFLGYINNIAMRFILSLAVLSYVYYSKLDRIFKRWSYSLSFKIRRLLRPIITSRPILLLIRNSPRFILRMFFLPLGAIIIFLVAFIINVIYLSHVFLICLCISGILCCLFVFFFLQIVTEIYKGRKEVDCSG
jgi:hypothetical protein